jgi:lincosamide and streptogramin A transport system ATP-binding/permease protein
VLLAALFLKENSFLLIDEPTNHLDLHARKLVSDYLNDKSGFILVSHDRAFLDNCVDHILAINKTNIEIQKGNFFRLVGEQTTAGPIRARRER